MHLLFFPKRIKTQSLFELYKLKMHNNECLGNIIAKNLITKNTNFEAPVEYSATGYSRNDLKKHSQYLKYQIFKVPNPPINQ